MPNGFATELLHAAIEWWNGPNHRHTIGERVRNASGFVLTGPDLISEVAECIGLDQSILLEGPRGCGKSFCIRAGIDEAYRRGFLPSLEARVTSQGNREIPRDYLSEDEITFTVSVQSEPYVDGDAAQTHQRNVVEPAKRSAPLFRFAVRDPETQLPVKMEGETKRVKCEMPDGRVCDRFVLFLDEINRYSDGVLDSLLSVLEERTAFLGGDEYQLPVTVCMTMNPPGYDSSARKLSPPLAARIGKSYRLSTPDVDTMSDFIASERWRIILSAPEARRTDLDGVDMAHPPSLPPSLLRRAALATLCMWGDVDLGGQKPGLEYLTPDSVESVRAVMHSDRELAQAMRTLSTLCHYGPDGRAIADWLVSATARAESRHSDSSRPVSVTEDDFVGTVVNSVGHKIYDSFSPATEPNLTVEKENAVRLIAWKVLNSARAQELVRRRIDSIDDVTEAFIKPFLNTPALGWERIDELGVKVRRAFLNSRVTSDDEFEMWCGAAASSCNKSELLEYLSSPQRSLANEIVMLTPDAEQDASRHSFLDQRNRNLVAMLAMLTEDEDELSGFGKAVVELDRAGVLGATRRSHEDELHDRLAVAWIGVDVFRAIVKKRFSPSREFELRIADALDQLRVREVLVELGRRARDERLENAERQKKPMRGAKQQRVRISNGVINGFLADLAEDVLRSATRTEDPDQDEYLRLRWVMAGLIIRLAQHDHWRESSPLYDTAGILRDLAVFLDAKSALEHETSSPGANP